MKVIKSNSACNYNFSKQKNFSVMNPLKQRILGSGDYNPVDTKVDASAVQVKDAGNSYIDVNEKTDFNEKPKSKENNLKNKIMKNYNTSKDMDTSNKQRQSNTGNFRPVEKPVTLNDLVNKFNNIGQNTNISEKTNFNKSESKSNYDRCIDGYVQEGLTRDEAKFGCRGESKQVNSAAKPWENAYDELDNETSKKKSETEFHRNLRNEHSFVKPPSTNPHITKPILANSDKKTDAKPKVKTRSSPVSKSKMDDLFADMDNTIKQHCGDAKNCRVTEANGQRSVTAWN